MVNHVIKYKADQKKLMQDYAEVLVQSQAVKSQQKDTEPGLNVDDQDQAKKWFVEKGSH